MTNMRYGLYQCGGYILWQLITSNTGIPHTRLWYFGIPHTIVWYLGEFDSNVAALSFE